MLIGFCLKYLLDGNISDDQLSLLSALGEQALTGDIPEQLKVSVVQSRVYFRSADLKIKRFMYRPKSRPALLFSFGFCENVSCELFNIF